MENWIINNIITVMKLKKSNQRLEPLFYTPNYLEGVEKCDPSPVKESFDLKTINGNTIES